ncbi:MAG: glycoside hydrolase family 2 [Clostridia bacterium]|jgi:beta-galactosidase/beta-glucuronidase|nr:glycoside hydrolase family 2 [Clostridia bacterium]
MLKKYPRPQFKREEWVNLNGKWQFEFDDANVGLKQEWWKGKKLSSEINVPYVFECAESGINDKTPHKYVWYARDLNVPKEWKGKRVFLNFGAVDYIAEVYVNGVLVKTHCGGNTAFSAEITDWVNYEKDRVYVRVIDDAYNELQPRGKQFWEDVPRVIWYTRSTGIWQSVFMECAGENYITDYEVYPDIDTGRAKFEVNVNEGCEDLRLELEITLNGKAVNRASVVVTGLKAYIELDIFHNRIMDKSVHGCGLCWSPENPVLFDVKFKLCRKKEISDEVTSYFGMRKIRAKNGEIWLNNHRYTMRLVLDQGYFKDGLLTPKCDEDLENDILLAKEMGFNGCRKHQKVECELFHYYADKLGFLVWGEMASCANYGKYESVAYADEWVESVKQRFNHPSVVVWVPANESWGVPDLRSSEQQRRYLSALYNLTKSIDGTRPVISNDGWEMVETDIIAIHNYAHGASWDVAQHKRYEQGLSCRDALIGQPSTNRPIFVEGYADGGQPLLLTEMGGVSFGKRDGECFGYSDVKTEDDLLVFLRRVFKSIYASSAIKGFCYTQFSDVEQEINGLVTADRKPKADKEVIAKIVKGEDYSGN